MGYHILALGQQGSEAQKEKAKSLADVASSAAEALRRMAIDLHPLVLDQLGLTAAIAQHISSLDDESQAELELQIEGEPVEGSLPDDVALTAYRVCQEALANALKHGEPRHVIVELVWEPHLLTLKVNDDGRGFITNQIEKDSPKLGLISMRERAKLAKGSLIVNSGLGDGTAIRLELPLR